MMLRIGNKAGFTLVEVMVTVAILSLGTVLIQQGLLRSSDVLNHLNNQLLAAPRIHETIWDVREALLFSEGGTAETSGSFTDAGRSFNWSAETNEISGADKLYEVRLNMVWSEGNRSAGLSRAVYLTAEKQPKF